MALARRGLGRRLSQHRPIVIQPALSGFGLSGVQTDLGVTSIVGAATADYPKHRKVQIFGARCGTKRFHCTVFELTNLQRYIARRRLPSFYASLSNTGLPRRRTCLSARGEVTGGIEAFSQECGADSVVARPALANMTARPAVVRVRERIAAGCGSRTSRSGAANASRRAAAVARNRRHRCASTDARSGLHALVVHAGERAVARAGRQARASQLSLSAGTRVVIVAAAAGARYRGQPNHQNPQSLVQSHRMNPFPYQRPEAFHASLREATLLEMAP